MPLIPEPERIHRVNRWPLLLILLGLGGCLQSHTLSSVPGEQETRISSTKPVPVDAPRPWQSYYHQVQADVAESMDNPYLALDEVEKALKYRPESIDLTLMKARLEEQIGQYGSALRTLNELTQAHPGRLKPWMELARVKRQLALSATDKSERVRLLKEIIPIYLDRVIAIDPLKEDAYVALFDLYSRTGQIQEGLKSLPTGSSGIRLQPIFPFTWDLNIRACISMTMPAHISPCPFSATRLLSRVGSLWRIWTHRMENGKMPKPDTGTS